MPAEYIYVCKNCSFENHLRGKNFDLGPLHGTFDGHTANTQSFSCAECTVVLSFPKRIDRAAWEQWKANDARTRQQIKRYAFVAGLVQWIDQALVKSAELPIEMGKIDCPYCHLALVPGVEIAPPGNCEKCGGTNLHWDGGGGISTLVHGYIWPPLPMSRFIVGFTKAAS